MEELTGLTTLQFTSDPDKRLSESEILKVHFAFKELLTHKPLQYVLGKAWFLDYTFRVGKGVLIPRPETEELVGWIQQDFKGKPGLKGLDIATGSGCIAISLSLKLSGLAMSATDISVEAIGYTSFNNRNLNAGVNIIEHDILNEPVPFASESFDFIVSNPPYVRDSEKMEMADNVLGFEPHQALFVPDNDPLIFYRKIALISQDLLKPGGALYFEINEAFSMEILHMLTSNGYINTELRNDFRGKPRMIKASKKSH
jgi:release factor glutamine methyltransferase